MINSKMDRFSHWLQKVDLFSKISLGGHILVEFIQTQQTKYSYFEREMSLFKLPNIDERYSIAITLCWCKVSQQKSVYCMSLKIHHSEQWL